MIHTAFLILVDPEQAADVNFALKGYDLVVLDDLLISPRTFSLVASTLKHLNNCPSILVAGDNCQQHPLQTVGGKVHNTISILSDGMFNATTRSSTHCISSSECWTRTMATSWISCATCSPLRLNWASFRRQSSFAQLVPWKTRRYSRPSAFGHKHPS